MRLVMVISILVVLLQAQAAFAQEIDYSLKPGRSRAVLNWGFSYDLLRLPTNVPFAYPEGQLSFNVPLDISTEDLDMRDHLEGDNEKLTPLVGARKGLNYAFRISVPMLRGVATYAQTENVNFDLDMNLGAFLSTDTAMSINNNFPMDSATVLLNGDLNIPAHFKMGWRTQTFGYVFKPRGDVTVAVQLHRHLFEATAGGMVNTNIDSGNVGLDMPGIPNASQDLPINYSEDQLSGRISGHYRGTAWSPAFGVKWWRLTLASRFGAGIRVRGSFTMEWIVPFFIDPDPKTLGLEEDELVVMGLTDNPDRNQLVNDFTGLEGRLSNAETDSFVLHTETDAKFNIPSCQTIAFEIIRDRLMLSYTFVHGGAISGYHENEAGETDLDLGVNLNHFLVLNLTLARARMTLGAFLLDFYETGKEHWLSESAGFGGWGGVPVPILNFSTGFGGAARVLLELDLLPIPALKSGLIFYF
jgi:hypothetical protein